VVRRSARVAAFADADPPVVLGANLVAASLARHPARIFIAGRAGAGKSTVAAVMAGTWPGLPKDDTARLREPVPVCNHADPVKDEVLEWLSRSRQRALVPGERATFISFCDFLGISPAIVERDLWEILGEVWEAMNGLLATCYEEAIPVQQWAEVPPGADIPAKAAFVERYEPLFRRPLHLYGEASRQLSGSEEFWAERTVDRGLAFRTCLNADTRFRAEAGALRAAGWIGIHLAISDGTQRQRLADPDPDVPVHRAGDAVAPEDCDVSIDGNRPLGRVVLDIAEWLNARGRSGPLLARE
jgi:hypothetical protein